jgi:hypothetical protein
VAVSLFDAHFVIQNCRFYAELLRNPCSERISILCFRADHVATDFGPKRGRGIQADDLAPIDDGNAIAVICFLHQVRRQQDGDVLLVAQAVERLPKIDARAPRSSPV